MDYMSVTILYILCKYNHIIQYIRKIHKGSMLLKIDFFDVFIVNQILF